MGKPVNPISSLFNKFAGREVPMKETIRTLKARHPDDFDMTYTEISLANPQDPTIKEMEKFAKSYNLSLRVWWDGVGGTCDWREDRVNAHIEKAADGKWRVSDRFDIG